LAGAHRIGRHRSSLGERAVVFGAVAVSLLVVVLTIAIVSWANRSTVVAGTGVGRAPTPHLTPTLQPPAPAPPVAPMVAVPVSVSIPRLGIISSLQPLGIDGDGSLQSPSQWDVAGWYAEGVRPGQVGPALIAGHVDSVEGPAVFYRLPSAQVGDDVVVVDATGVARHFTVNDIEEYPKQKFPSQAVYGPAALPLVRLVTCYGAFDRSQKSYVDNMVVTAVLRT
jgi:hypothetical protein